MYAPNSASTKKPGAPLRLPIGSIFSIVHAAGSGSPVGHALPRARTLPSGSVLDAQLQVVPGVGLPLERHRRPTRCVSGSHGSIFSCCALP